MSLEVLFDRRDRWARDCDAGYAMIPGSCVTIPGIDAAVIGDEIGQLRMGKVGCS